MLISGEEQNQFDICYGSFLVGADLSMGASCYLCMAVMVGYELSGSIFDMCYFVPKIPAMRISSVDMEFGLFWIQNGGRMLNSPITSVFPVNLPKNYSAYKTCFLKSTHICDVITMMSLFTFCLFIPKPLIHVPLEFDLTYMVNLRLLILDLK